MALQRLILTLLLACVVAVGGVDTTPGDAAAYHGLLRDLQNAANGTCPSLCANGTAMMGGDASLPIFVEGPQTCADVEALLAANDQTACAVISTYLQFLDLGAYCQCEGSDPPSLCSPCSDGGSIEEPDKEFTVEFLNGISFSCRQGASFVSYLTSAFACSGFTALFDAACCSAPGTPTAPTAGGGGTTSAPAATPTTTVTTDSPAGAPSAVTTPTAAVPTVGTPTIATPTVETPTIDGPTVETPTAAMPTTGGGEMPSASPNPATADMPSVSPVPSAASPTTGGGGDGSDQPSAPSSPTSGPTSMAASVAGSYVGAVTVMLTVVVASYLS